MVKPSWGSAKRPPIRNRESTVTEKRIIPYIKCARISSPYSRSHVGRGLNVIAKNVTATSEGSECESCPSSGDSSTKRTLRIDKFVTQKLRHYYFLAHSVILVTKSNPLRYLLSRPVMLGRTARWLLQLNEYDITVVNLKKLRNQALSDLIAQFSSGKCEPLYEELPGEEICSLETKVWRLAFDGSSTHQGGDAGVVLYDAEGVNISLSFKLEFPCSNNVAEYEALLLGLISALKLGVKKLRVQGDSKLIVEQVNREFALKEAALVEYGTAAQKLIKSFSSIQFEHVPRAQNKHADA